MYQLWEYIKFKFKSTNQHGVHSPFIFDLITKCFYDKKQYDDYVLLQDYKRSLLASKDLIEVTDLGEGSKVFKTHNRHVKTIAKTSASLDKNMKLMYRLYHYFKPKQTLELGTSLGVATYAMALGNPDGTITTIEGCPKTSSYTENCFAKRNIENVSFKHGHFKAVIPKLSLERLDFVFVDGHHNKQATLDYFEMLLPKTHNDSVFVFDDIYWSKGMTEAWELIKQHPKVIVTVDTFFWGLVFLRSEQAREHFKIRL